MEAQKEPLSIVVVGAGNVATNLTLRIMAAGHTISQIVGSSSLNAEKLAKQVNCAFTLNINEIFSNAHLYIIAVPDSAIQDVVDKFPHADGLVVHTSGSTPIDVFEGKFANYGVFYPFQTFSPEREVNLHGIPLCIEANSENNLSLLASLAEAIGANAIEMDSETRRWLHVSGVFACNFVNHMLALSQVIAEENGFDFELLKPLVSETVKKALDGNPLKMQTGPAVRGDSETIKKHIIMLSSMSDELREIYMSISDSIWQLSHGEE